MTTKRRKTAARLALAENLMLAPMVMAMRMPIMSAEAAGSMLSGKKSESAGAVAEKWQAMTDGMAAAQFAWMQSAFMLPFSLAKATSAGAPFMDMASDIAVAALQPAGRQVRLNHRRLSRRGAR